MIMPPSFTLGVRPLFRNLNSQNTILFVSRNAPGKPEGIRKLRR
jgi:hypothetical protein